MTPTRDPSRSDPDSSLSPARRRLFGVLLATIPVLFFGLVEAGLRNWWTGPDMRLVRIEQIAGVPMYVTNAGVKDRYFFNISFSPSGSPDEFYVHKPPGVFRIFFLGASTTIGYPYYYNASFSTLLRERLKAQFPDREFEVVNFGMTATNSFTVLDMAREVVCLDPDLIIVYDGHNEFYGALGVASNVSLGSSRFLAQSYLQLINFRTFVWLRDRLVGLFGASQRAELTRRGTMMERLARGQAIPRESELYQAGLQTFRDNLQDLRDLCRENRIPLLLSAQVSNVRDQRPFISERSAHFSPEEISFWIDQPRWQPETIRRVVAAASVDSMSADLHFLAGRMLLGEDPDSALTFLFRARDLDQLRFRASTDFNDAIMEMADGYGVRVVDMEQVFSQLSSHGLPGNELLTEHLHPNSRGYFLMARAYGGSIRAWGLIASSDEWVIPDDRIDRLLWDQRPISELDERIAQRRTEILVSGWPFKDQFPQVNAVPATDTLGVFADRVTDGRWDWRTAHEAARTFQELRGAHEELLREDRALLSLSPREVGLYHLLARHLFEQQRLDEMRDVLLASLRVSATPLAHRALGDYYMSHRQPESAISHYRALRRLSQSVGERLENGYLLSVALIQNGELAEGKNILLEVLDLNPDYPPAVQLLGQISTKSLP
jgi:tetratricopeptide (TPR) repeat protein